MYATKMISPSQIQKPYKRSLDNLFFYASWELVLWQIFGTMTPDISPIITGIDSYTGNYTYSGVRDNYYNAKIGDNWNQRQIINGVSKPESTIAGLLNGSGLWIWGDLQLGSKKTVFRHWSRKNRHLRPHPQRNGEGLQQQQLRTAFRTPGQPPSTRETRISDKNFADFENQPDRTGGFPTS